MIFGRRSGIGRFGVGMKTAALSMGPRLDVYSWQERGAIYGMSIDLQEIGASTKNLIELPEPELRDRFPDEVASLLTSPMSFPKNSSEFLSLSKRRFFIISRDALGAWYARLHRRLRSAFKQDDKNSR